MAFESRLAPADMPVSIDDLHEEPLERCQRVKEDRRSCRLLTYSWQHPEVLNGLYRSHCDYRSLVLDIYMCGQQCRLAQHMTCRAGRLSLCRLEREVA